MLFRSILTTLRALDAIPSFAQRVAYINERSAKGAINNDVYRAFSLVVVKLDMRDTKNEREKRKAQEEKRELSLPDQAPLKWAYYWRRTNALADELEKPGGMVSYADVEDVRGRFRSEPKSLQDTIRDRIGGTALSFITLSDRERAAQRMSLNRIIQTAEMVFGGEKTHPHPHFPYYFSKNH